MLLSLIMFFIESAMFVVWGAWYKDQHSEEGHDQDQESHVPLTHLLVLGRSRPHMRVLDMEGIE